MLVSVSTMPAGENLKEYLNQIKQYTDFLHCDVCDGKYNNTICFSPKMAKAVNNIVTLPLDVHLMTKNTLIQAKKYIKAGVNIITSQLESFNSSKAVDKFINLVKSNKTLVGLSLEPETKIDAILPYINKLDLVLIMAVKTGSSGQKFKKSVIDKINQISELKKNYNFKIQVDGGIDNNTIKLVKNLGVDIVVSGSYVYNNSDKQQAINSLK